MKKLKTLLVLFLVLGLAIVGAACSSGSNNADGTEQNGNTAGSEEKIEIKFAHEEAETDLQGMYANKFKEILEAKTNGKVEVKIYPVGTLGTDLNIAEQLQQGVVQFAISSPGTTGSIVPEAQIVALKFLFSDDPKVNYKVLTEGKAFNEMIAGEYEKHNMKVLHFWPEGFNSWTSNKVIKTPDDLKGYKMRTQTSPLMVKSYEVFGANPTPLDFSEVYTGLQLGTIDGQENPNFFIESTNLYEVQKYLINARHSIYVTSTVANKEYYDSLPDDVRKAVEETINELKPYAFEIEQKANNEALERMKATGKIEVIELDESARAKFKELSVPAHQLYVETAGGKAQEILDTLKKEIEEAEKEAK
ncbi:MAG: DctP family TRAP transporter solute-binding subunit [Brevibacillus sp.]|nr:DctP family TRAP transporter solute-binding subunit [Brevibacillus sp.]